MSRLCWIFLFAASLPVPLELRAAEDLTLEWILDSANTRPLQVPRYQWLSGDALILDDPRKPEAERGLEVLDTKTLERKPAGDRSKILESWKALLEKDQGPRTVGMPSAATADGKTFLYDRGGDLYVLDLEKGSVRRLTNTEAAEQNPRFSPDGKWIAYVRDNDLYAVETASGREKRLTRDGGPSRLNGALSWVYWEEIMNRRDEAFWWSPDSTAILYFQSDESTVPGFPLVDHESPAPAVRWQRYPKAGGVNPVVRAGILELSNPEPTRWIDLGSNPPEYLARVVWLPDGKRAAVQTLNRAQDHLQLWFADRSSGACKPALEDRSKTWINLHDEHFFVGGGDRFIWSSERDGLRRLYSHPSAGGEPVLLTRGDLMLKGAGGHYPWNGSVAWADQRGTQVFFHAGAPAAFGVQVYRGDSVSGECARLSEGDGTHHASFSPSGRLYVDEYSRSGVPPRLTLHRSDGTLLHVIAASAADRLAGLGFASPRIFTVPADDGTPLPARLLPPSPMVEGKRYPAIVHIYGGPTAPQVGDSWEGSGYLWMQLLSRRGFAVFTVDPRSSSDRGKAFEDAVHRRFYGDLELKDILAGVRHLKSLPFVDPDRVGIWGWSGGGTNTMYAMTHSSEFRAGIAVAGVGDQRYYDTVYTERYMGKPAENEEGYRSTATANSADKLHGRLLIVHGTADDNVHFQNALRVIHSLIAAGKQFDLMIYPRRDHGIGDPAARRHLFRLMLDFWERWLEAPAGVRRV